MSLNKKLGDDFIWSLKYRPKEINDVVLPDKIKDNFNNMLSSKKIPNLLLYGNAGVGKTTIATILADKLGCDVLYVNGSIETSIDVLRGKISQFVTTVSFDGQKKLVIIDESDRFSAQTMDATKSFLEQYSKNTSFIFITNNIHKIIEPLKSRLQTIDFNFNKNELSEIKKQFAKITLDILDGEGVTYNKKILAGIINNYFPDMRKTLNELQKNHLRLNDPSLLDECNVDLELYYKLIKDRDFNGLQNYCAMVVDCQSFFSSIYDNLKKYIEVKDIPAVIKLTSDYCYKSNFIKDQRITLMTYSCEIMNNIKVK